MSFSVSSDNAGERHILFHSDSPLPFCHGGGIVFPYCGNPAEEYVDWAFSFVLGRFCVNRIHRSLHPLGNKRLHPFDYFYGNFLHLFHLLFRKGSKNKIHLMSTGKIIADLCDTTKDVILAKGGNGGFGNSHFATPTRQAPNFAKNGQKGDEREITLELKLLADVGLLGFPNVGKSTILSMTTKADPKIANYHFTTLEPNLGVVSLGEGMSFVLADIPGIIEGASEGAGLGHEFLRHIERTRLLIHVVDVSSIEGRNPISDFDIINGELKKYNLELENRPQIIAANKTDIIQDQKAYDDFISEMKKRGYKVFPISAASNQGIKELMKYAYEELSKLPPIREFDVELDVLEPKFVDKTDKGFEIKIEDGVYVIFGSWIESVVQV